MEPAEPLLRNLILVGGPPRSGTTILARSLALHPDIVGLIDDHVHEFWALYHYPDRTGLVRRLRQGPMGAGEVHAALLRPMIRSGAVHGVYAAPDRENWPGAAPPIRPDGTEAAANPRVDRRAIPLESWNPAWDVCLKSPEISFVLEELADAFPDARFCLVYRPLEEIAESMYRKAAEVKKVRVYNARWRQEIDELGQPVPPPGVPAHWHSLWPRVTDFQRCLLYAGSYLDALAATIPRLGSSRCFVYHHHHLLSEPAAVFRALSAFLGRDPAGFAGVPAGVRPDRMPILAELRMEMLRLTADADLTPGYVRLETLAGRWASGATGGGKVES